MNKINVEKVIDYTKVLKDNEILQDMDKILRNENTNLKLRISKAIEYIEQLTNDEESIELMDINSLVQEELLKILKGVELTENDKKQVKWLKEEFKVGVDKE